MAYSTIIKPNTQMNPVLYTGNGGTQSITGVNFQPDFTWIKDRDSTAVHYLFNAVSGATKFTNSDQNYAEQTNTQSLKSFDTDGFTLGTMTGANNNTNNFASWNWKAGGSPSSNTDGTITSSVSANTTSGFSVATYTGNGTGSATVGHGLGVAPAFVIIKNISSVDAWIVFPTGATRLVLNSTAGDYGNNGITKGANTITLPSGVDNAWNTNGQNYIAYCFADVKGFSKMGSYVGNGSTDGTFIYTGFSPSFIMFKNASVTESWTILDLKRASVPNANPNANVLWPNDNFAEYDETQGIDFLSNGFKVRESATGFNGSGNTIIYMAFAENPLVANTSGGIPTTAR